MNRSTIKALVLGVVALSLGACAAAPQEMRYIAKVGATATNEKYKDFSVFEGKASAQNPGISIGMEIDPGQRDRIIFSGAYQQVSDIEFDGLYTGVDDVGTIETDMFTVSGGYRHPFTDRFSAGARLGVAAVDISEREVFGGVPERSSISNTVPFGGVTMKYAVTDRFAISANYERYLDVDEDGGNSGSDVGLYGVSFDFAFGTSGDND